MQETISKEEQQRKKIAREKIAKLVQEFKEKVIDSGKKESYTESDVKHHFLDKLFKALGWGTHDIRYEEGRIDYLFRLDNKKVMVIEAKRPSVSLKVRTASGNKVAKQAVNYAYNSRIEICAVADFEELVVYHGLRKPRDITKNLILLTKTQEFSLSYDNYLTNFEELWLLSKDSFKENRLDKFLDVERKKHKPVDEELLTDFLNFRRVLSKDIKKNNQGFSSEEIDWAVQKILGRFMFIRSTEDRGLEEQNLLLNKVKDFEDSRTSERLWPTIIKLFHKFNRVYNSGLFQNDLIDYGLKLSDTVIAKVIKGLYFGTSGGNERYEFDLIPADLLGQIYEQYLGELLRDTEKRVKLEKSKTKRKSMGIYYTPKYIVDYIVENTVVEYCKGKSLKELTEVKIVDPACGSGSFLQVAFEQMQEEYIKQIEKGKKFGIFDSLEKDSSGNPKLTLGQKNHILINNIFGVDLDEKAVEIAKLSLVLKMLEGESGATKKRRIETLKDNIQCGNSLIDDPKVAGDKSFKWKARFPEIFRAGGFDIVIGNPPYVRADTDNYEFIKQRKFLQQSKNYETLYEKWDLYIAFIERSLKIQKIKGRLGFIIPQAFSTSKYSIRLLEYILEKCEVYELDYFENLEIFKGVGVLPMLIFIKNKKKLHPKPKRIVRKNNFKNVNLLPKISSKTVGINLFRKNYSDQNIKFKDVELLKNICYISKGMVLNSDEKTAKGEFKKTDLISDKLDSTHPKKYIEGKNVSRYIIKKIRYLEWNTSRCPEKLSRKTFPELYSSPKLLHGRMTEAVFDDSNILCNDSLYVFVKFSSLKGINNRSISNYVKKWTDLERNALEAISEKYNLKYLLSIVNSKLAKYYLNTIRRSNLSLYPDDFRKLPIKLSKDQKPLIDLVDRMIALNKKLQEEKLNTKQERIQKQIQDADYEIDQLVYKGYGLTKEEIKIVEDSLK